MGDSILEYYKVTKGDTRCLHYSPYNSCPGPKAVPVQAATLGGGVQTSFRESPYRRVVWGSI